MKSPALRTSSWVRKLKLHHLRVVVAVCLKGSLSRAAEALDLTQPALTRSLHEVETIVGQRLFERHARGVTANELGNLVASVARRILGDLEELQQQVTHKLDQQSAVLRVGALPAAALGLLPDAISRLQVSDPAMQVIVQQDHTAPLLESLQAGRIELIIGRLYDELLTDTRYECVPLYNDHVSILARAEHPLFQQRDIDPKQLSLYPLTLPTQTSHSVMEVEQLLSELPLQVTVQMESNSVSLTREWLLRTNCLTIMPRLTLAGDLQRGQIREVMRTSLTRDHGLITLKDHPLSDAATALITALQTQITSLRDNDGL